MSSVEVERIHDDVASAGEAPVNAFAASGAKNLKKQEYFARLESLIGSHDEVIIVEADNVGSKQMSEIRVALRGRATLLMGKNTMIKTCLKRLLGDRPEIASLIDLVKDNIGLVFCQDDLSEIRKTILEFRVPAPAKLGALAPCDVFIPPGPTGMDPGQTSFFQSLGIPTKIVKGQIEIQNEVHIIKTGDRVSASQAVLLNKLNIRPFSYGLKTQAVWDHGSVYPASVLDLSQNDIVKSIQQAVSLTAQLSLGAGRPTKCSVSHSILNAFQKVAQLALGVDFIFPELEALKNAIENPQAAGPVSATPAPAEAAKPAAAKVEEEEEESEDGDFGISLFD